jgi:hypothetical protein
VTIALDRIYKLGYVNGSWFSFTSLWSLAM